jgi:REP element-mobilizing transposase RayT
MADCYHVTSITVHRTPIFSEPPYARVLDEAIQFVRRDRAYVLAYAIMPDHFHALVIPRAPHTVSQVMQTIKGYSSREINRQRSMKGRVWQPGFHDRVMRSDAQLEATVAYIEANPVEEELVARPE